MEISIGLQGEEKHQDRTQEIQNARRRHAEIEGPEMNWRSIAEDAFFIGLGLILAKAIARAMFNAGVLIAAGDPTP